MTSAQVVETSVIDNSSFQNSPHQDDHTIQTKVLTFQATYSVNLLVRFLPNLYGVQICCSCIDLYFRHSKKYKFLKSMYLAKGLDRLSDRVVIVINTGSSSPHRNGCYIFHLMLLQPGGGGALYYMGYIGMCTALKSIIFE